MNSNDKKTAFKSGAIRSKPTLLINTIFIIVFIMLIVFPLIFSDKEGGKGTMNEQRLLATFPEYGFDIPISKTLSGLEDWINDNTGGRNKAIRIDTLLQYHLFDQSARKNVLIGKDDWIFYYTDEIIKDYQNAIPPSADELEKIKTNFHNVAAECDRRDITFLGVLVPDKKTVYPEQYPDSVLKVDDVSRSQIIMETLVNADINYIYLLDALMEEKNEGTLYSPRIDDAHWNNYGAFIGYLTIMERLSKASKSIMFSGYEDYDIKPFVQHGMFNGTIPVEEVNYDIRLKNTAKTYIDDQSYFDRFPQLKFAGVREDYGHHSINVNKDLPRILFIGDSYGLKLHEYFMQSSSEYTSIHVSDMSWIWSIIEDIAPDIVIYENVERQISEVNRNINMPPMALTSLPDTTVPFPKGMFSYNIDAVNNEWRDSAIQGNTITVDPNTVSTFISGWAIDANANKSASGVVIKLGDEVITARYGLGSDDIVQYFGEQVYNNCRFEVALNTERLTEEGKFTVYIVSDDNSYVYEPVVYTVKSK